MSDKKEIIPIACDHGGFETKEYLVKFLREKGYEMKDLGTFSPDSVDYPDFIHPIAKAVNDKVYRRGIILCGSGVGACIAANKIKGIYAAVCHDTYSAHQGVEHDNMNVLCLGARIVGAELAKELVQAFLAAKFSSDVERHVRRVNKIYQLEKNANE